MDLSDLLYRLATETWPARALKTAVSAATLPGDVYAGRVDPLSDEAIGRASNLAGVVGSGGLSMAPGASARFGGRLAKTANLDALREAQRLTTQGDARDHRQNLARSQIQRGVEPAVTALVDRMRKDFEPLTEDASVVATGSLPDLFERLAKRSPISDPIRRGWEFVRGIGGQPTLQGSGAGAQTVNGASSPTAP
jgi:hypothetical protein